MCLFGIELSFANCKFILKLQQPSAPTNVPETSDSNQGIYKLEFFRAQLVGMSRCVSHESGAPIYKILDSNISEKCTRIKL